MEEISSQHKSNKDSKNSTEAIFGFLGFFVILAMVIFMAPASILPRLGMQMYEVVTGSMEPEIPVGSLVCVEHIEPDAIEAGAVVTYTGGGLGQDAIVTHRVVDNNSNERTFITKGDANSTDDPYPIPYEQILGVVKWHIPVMGTVYSYFSTPYGKLTGMGGIGVGLLFFALESLLAGKRKKTKAE